MTTWEIGGAEALRTCAPDAAKAYDAVVEVRPIRVHDEVLESPGVRAFAEQFRTDASQVTDEQRAGLRHATGERLVEVAQMVWIGVVGARLRAALDDLFGPSEWESPRRFPVADVSLSVTAFVESAGHPGARDLPAATALAAALAGPPSPVDPDVVDAVRRELTPEQAVDVVLDLVRDAADKVAVALGDAGPELPDGVDAPTTKAGDGITTF